MNDTSRDLKEESLFQEKALIKLGSFVYYFNQIFIPFY